MSQAHSRFEELLPAHVLGALDGAERAEMEAHLVGCGTCRQQWVQWEEVLVSVAEDVAPEPVSAELRERVLATTERPLTAGYQAVGEPTAGTVPEAGSPVTPETLVSTAADPAPPTVFEATAPSRRGGGSWVPWLALAASLLALVVSWAGWMTRDLPGLPGAEDPVASGPETPGDVENGDERLAATIGELDQARAEIEILRQRMDRLTLAVQALGSPRGRTYALATDNLDDAPRGAVGATFVDSELGRGTFHVFGLPRTADDKTYQLWRIHDGTPESAGTFQVAADGSASLSVDALEPAEGDVWAVTIEPAGGVPQPTGTMVLKSG